MDDINHATQGKTFRRTLSCRLSPLARNHFNALFRNASLADGVNREMLSKIFKVKQRTH